MGQGPPGPPGRLRLPLVPSATMAVHPGSGPATVTRSWTAPAMLALALTAAACGSGPPGAQAPPTSAAVTAVAPPPPIAWTACPTRPTVECGSVPVPLDYDHPESRSLTIAVTRIPAVTGHALDGTLVMNPGGPGESGNQILPIEYPLLPAQVRDRMDVVGFDPRGTGASSPLRCGTELAAVTSALPVPSRPGDELPGTPVFAGIPTACSTAAPELIRTVDTVATARDMDRIRQALGLPRVSYYGLSYGTVLGTVYASLFPHRVAAMVLDGAVDQFAPLSVQATEQAPAAERSLVHLLASCATGPSCPLGADPTAFFTRLSASIAARPLPAPGNGDLTPVTLGDLDTATLFAISVPGFTPLYYSALVAAIHGDGSGLRSLALEFVVDVGGAPLVDAQWAITCNDTTHHLGPRAAGTLARALSARSPMIGGFTVNYNLGGCVTWWDSRRPVSSMHPDDAPPVLVIGNTGDPNTPLIGARHLASAYPHATQLTWVGWGHTWLLSGSTDSCVQAAVTRYLASGHLPPPAMVCH